MRTGGARPTAMRAPCLPPALGLLRCALTIAGMALTCSWRSNGAPIQPGGRALVRAARCMVALVASRWNPVTRNFDQRLLAAGRPKEAALTAGMRKLLPTLNCMLKNGQSWNLGTPDY